MGAYMYRQGATLDEAFPAGRIFATVRSIIGMNALVSDKVRLPVEALLKETVSPSYSSPYFPCAVITHKPVYPFLEGKG
jgi:hypothetical protein